MKLLDYFLVMKLICLIKTHVKTLDKTFKINFLKQNVSHYGSIKFITNGRKNFHQIILPVFLEKVDWSLAYEWLKSSSLTLGILVLRALGYSAYSLSSKRMVRVLLSCWEALAAAASSAFALKPSQLKIFPNVEDFSCVLSRSPTGSLFFVK